MPYTPPVQQVEPAVPPPLPPVLPPPPLEPVVQVLGPTIEQRLSPRLGPSLELGLSGAMRTNVAGAVGPRMGLGLDSDHGLQGGLVYTHLPARALYEADSGASLRSDELGLRLGWSHGIGRVHPRFGVEVGCSWRDFRGLSEPLPPDRAAFLAAELGAEVFLVRPVQAVPLLRYRVDPGETRLQLLSGSSTPLSPHQIEALLSLKIAIP